MEIVNYTTDHAEALTDVYNCSTADCMHCQPIEPGILAETLGSETESVLAERVFVSIDSGRPTGFSHAVIRTLKDDSRCAAIRFLSYAPGNRASGLALLRHTIGYFREENFVQILAFDQDDQYPFYHRNHAYLSDRVGHVQALLSCEGFTADQGEVHLDWDDYDPGEPFEIEQPVEMTWTQLESAGSISAFEGKATIGDTVVGVCHVTSCADRYKGEEDRLFVNWLGVEEAFQGKGYGRFILQEALREGKRLGYRHAAISTDLRNHRAYAFYTNYGFRVTDWTYGWVLDD